MPNMNIQVELGEEDLKKLVVKALSEIMNYEIKPSDITIEVKSKQNYKSEWEVAAFRARINKS